MSATHQEIMAQCAAIHAEHPKAMARCDAISAKLDDLQKNINRLYKQRSRRIVQRDVDYTGLDTIFEEPELKYECLFCKKPCEKLCCFECERKFDLLYTIRHDKYAAVRESQEEHARQFNGCSVQ